MGRREASMMSINEDEALAWIADVFEEPVDSVRPGTPRDAIVTWDSLGVLTLMAGLDERFGLAVSSDDVTAMQSVDDILAFLRRHKRLTDS
jgi:acyl carrier protein